MTEGAPGVGCAEAGCFFCWAQDSGVLLRGQEGGFCS
jgi:hypothetical protein